MQVAILCNHQRAVPKGHAGQMEKLGERMHKLNEELLELQHELKAAEKGKAYGDKKKREPERSVLYLFAQGMRPGHMQSRSQTFQQCIYRCVCSCLL